MGVVIIKGEGAVLEVNMGHTIITNEDGNYFREDLFLWGNLALAGGTLE